MTAARRKGERDHGCYARKTRPCVGYLSHGCRHCGRIITLELIERGDAVSWEPTEVAIAERIKKP